MDSILRVHDWDRIRALRGEEKRTATQVMFYLFSLGMISGVDMGEYIVQAGFSRTQANAAVAVLGGFAEQYISR